MSNTTEDVSPSEKKEETTEPSCTENDAAAAPKESGGEAPNESGAAPKEEESTAEFTPVVKLEEVEVKSGEEEVLFGVRAKLFIFGETLLDQGTGKKTWRERGIGEVRILRHREHQRIRVLMRQEKTMKVIANHVVDPRIKLEANAGSDRSWVYSAFDFAEGELIETVFALCFSDSEVANTFKEKFLECQKEMERFINGDDKEDESGDVDKAAESLSELKTSE